MIRCPAPLCLMALASLALLATARRAPAEDAFFIRPYLQNASQTGVTVQWWTNRSEPDSRVEFGPGLERRAPASDEPVATAAGKFLHRAVLAGLEPETRYPYRVRSGTLVSADHTFRTAARRTSGFHAAILGDSRTDDDEVIGRARQVLALARDQGPDLALFGGDFVFSGDQVHWDRFWRRILTASDPADPGLDVASRIPCYLVVGNHEIYQVDGSYGEGNLGSTMARYAAYVDVPPNGSANPGWEERYYSFTYGVATFIVMDANNTSDDALDNHQYLPDGSTPDWQPGSEQYEWLVERLAAARDSSAFTFVLMHPSPYSRGVHGAPDQSQSGWQIRALDPVFRQYGVDAVLASHDHTVERCLTGPPGYEEAMVDGDEANLNYLVMGNSGKSARPAAEGWETWMDITGNDGPPYYTRYFYDWIGTDLASFIDLSVEDLGDGGFRAHFQIMRTDGEVFDPLSLVRRDPLFSRSTHIEESRQPGAPQGLRLRQSYPNPFNGGTTLVFDLPAGEPRAWPAVSLEVYDILGRRVRTLVDGGLQPGRHRAFWDGRSDAGATVASGRYFFVVTAGPKRLSRAMTRLK